MSEQKAGRLFLCATPIGNLEDVTFRLLRILSQVDLIAAEDTRQTRKLLAKYDIHTPLTSYHAHNETNKSGQILISLQGGQQVALVSDAGMPGISDPGYELVKAAVEAGIEITPIPGPVAAVTALAASGLPTARFCFEGFLPRQKKERRKALAALAREARTLVFYESPHRLQDMLAELLAVLGDRRIVLARELTKVHEEFWRGQVSEALGLLASRNPRGEYTVVVEGFTGEDTPENAATTATPDVPLDIAMDRLVAAGMAEKDALKQLARERRRSKSDLYREYHMEKQKNKNDDR